MDNDDDEEDDDNDDELFLRNGWPTKGGKDTLKAFEDFKNKQRKRMK